MEQGIKIILILFKIYICCGFIFGIYFYFAGGERLDPQLKTTSKKTKLLFIPGAIILWAYLLPKIIKP